MSCVIVHIRLRPPEGGLERESAVLCEAIRSVTPGRFVERWGAVSTATLRRAEDVLRVLLGLR